MKYLLDVKLSLLDGDKLIVTKKGGILPASVELLLGKFLNLSTKHYVIAKVLVKASPLAGSKKS